MENVKKGTVRVSVIWPFSVNRLLLVQNINILLRRMPHQLDEVPNPGKHLRIDAVGCDLTETKLRRESADSGTSSSEAIIRVDSPNPSNQNLNSESDSGRPETPSGIQASLPNGQSTPQKQKISNSLNPFGISGILAAQSPPKRKPVPGQGQPQGHHHSHSGPQGHSLPPSAFSNPSLHSAAVHHRNLQAAAVSNAIQFSTLMNLNNNIAAIQAAAAVQATNTTSSSLGHQGMGLINPFSNPLLSQYHPLLQQRTNPLSKYRIIPLIYTTNIDYNLIYLDHLGTAERLYREARARLAMESTSPTPAEVRGAPVRPVPGSVGRTAGAGGTRSGGSSPELGQVCHVTSKVDQHSPTQSLHSLSPPRPSDVTQIEVQNSP